MNKQNLKLGESYNRYMQMYVYARHHVNVMYNAIYIYILQSQHIITISYVHIFTRISHQMCWYQKQTAVCLCLWQFDLGERWREREVYMISMHLHNLHMYARVYDTPASRWLCINVNG